MQTNKIFFLNEIQGRLQWFRLLAPKAGGTELDSWSGNRDLTCHMGWSKKIFFKGMGSHCLHQAFVEGWSPQSWEHPVGANVFTHRGRDGWPLLCCVEEGGGESAGLDSSVSPGSSGWGRRGGVVLRDSGGVS